MSVAYVTPQIIAWARQRAGLSIDQLAGSLKLDPRTLSAWELGRQVPPFGRAERLAEKLRIPFGYLFLSSPPQENVPLPDLRTVGNASVSTPSIDFLDVVNDAVLRQQWYSEYLQEIGARKLAFVDSCKIADGFQTVAADMSKALGIDAQSREAAGSWESFLSFITQKAENLGILVMRRGVVGNYTNRRLNVEEFRGFAVADKFAPLVFINARDANAAKNFTIVHGCVACGSEKVVFRIPIYVVGPRKKKTKSKVFCNRVAD